VRRLLPFCLVVLLLTAPPSFGQSGYQKPPKAISDILAAPPTPQVSVSPTRDHLLLIQGVNYPPIADLAEPMLRLAGLRISPATNGPHASPRIVGLTLQTIADGKQQKVTLPDGARLGAPGWSPDGKHFAFLNTTANAIELWIGEVETGKVRPVPGIRINAVYGTPWQWMPGSQTILCQSVPADHGKAPEAPRVPKGPKIQENSGKRSPVWTYQDLLKSAHDEDLFDYYAASQLVLVDVDTLKPTPLGKPALVSRAAPSPDGKHFLVVRTHRPYSYLLPASAFPSDVEVWDREGKLVKKVSSRPMADQVPIDGVPTGPRGYSWRPTAPATLVWVEALDGGDPKRKVAPRDRVMMWKAPFQGEPVEVVRTQHRFAGLTWGEKNGLALLKDFDRKTRRSRTFRLEVDSPGKAPLLIWDLSIQERYKDPGTPLTRTLASGQRVLWQDGDSLFLSGKGATPEGDRPFLDRLDMATWKSKRLFQSAEKTYETVVGLLSPDGSRFLTRYETPNDPPNYYVRTVDGGDKKALTSFTDPAPQLRGIKKQLVKYKRADGVPLSFTLYLPPNYKDGQRLPALVWAYPREFTDVSVAGQVSGSPYHFTTIGGPSHLFLLLAGYAVLDGASMPVVGDPETVNNTYIDQIVSSAKAAIAQGDKMGVIDPKRVAVGGHSYGAFMTANLLAHSDLFRAGIARSGAYNRTLTPFGFQAERRTLWEAPEVYLKMSPFMYAHQIKTPLLIIHGEADNNPGTFPVQSERLYHAIKGNGGTVRYVTLPYESHGYMARESVEHVLYEMISWCNRYVKK
jgi:dipeptidyl aminopeptidase/acylaminoacyl peptidase